MYGAEIPVLASRALAFAFAAVVATVAARALAPTLAVMHALTATLTVENAPATALTAARGFKWIAAAIASAAAIEVARRKDSMPQQRDIEIEAVVCAVALLFAATIAVLVIAIGFVLLVVHPIVHAQELRYVVPMRTVATGITVATAIALGVTRSTAFAVYVAWATAVGLIVGTTKWMVTVWVATLATAGIVGRIAAPATLASVGRITAPATLASVGRITAPATLASVGWITAPATLVSVGRTAAPASLATIVRTAASATTAWARGL